MSLKEQLIVAIREGDNMKVSNLVDRLDVSAVNGRSGRYARTALEDTALHAAVGHQNDRALTLILAKPGIDVNVQDRIGRTILHRHAISKLLAIPGIDINAQDTDGDTPLHIACRDDNDQDVARLLATPGIRVNIQNKYGSTPLHKTSFEDNYLAAARLLATSGIHVNVKDKLGRTPVMEAVGPDSEETFKLLLHDHRVDLDVKCNEGRSLEEIVRLPGNSVESQKCLDLIKEERMKRENVCKKKDEESTGIVIEKIEKINKKIKDNEQRWTDVVEKQELESESLASKHQEEKAQQELESERLGRKYQEEKTQQELEREKLARKHQEEITQKELERENLKRKHQEEKTLQELESEKLAREHQEKKTQQELEREKLARKHQEEKTRQEKTFAREAECNKQHINNLTDVRNDLAQDLEKIHFEKRKNDATNNSDDHDKLEAARGSLECPICLEFMEPPKKIWMCTRTHAMCEACKIFLNGKPCPTCESGSVNLRAYMIEKMAGIVFSKSEV